MTFSGPRAAAAMAAVMAESIPPLMPSRTLSETVLDGVVARPEHESVVDLLDLVLGLRRGRLQRPHFYRSTGILPLSGFPNAIDRVWGPSSMGVPPMSIRGILPLYPRLKADPRPILEPRSLRIRDHVFNCVPKIFLISDQMVIVLILPEPPLAIEDAVGLLSGEGFP